MIPTNQFRRGMKIELDGQPYIISEFQHVKPGKGGAFVRTKLKSLITGSVLDHTFRSGEKVKKPDFEEKEMQFLYGDDGGGYHFMDLDTYDQISISSDELGNAVGFLQEQISVTVQLYNGKSIGVELPIFVSLRIVKSEPGLKGDTASGATKPAELETGAVIQVPLFVEEGDVVKIDTRTGEYIERAR